MAFEYRNLKFILKQGKSHHIGVFQNKAAIGIGLKNNVKIILMQSFKPFAYTGGASFVVHKLVLRSCPRGCFEISC